MLSRTIRFHRTILVALAATASLLGGLARADLIFNFIDDSGTTDQSALDAFGVAGNLWSDIFVDDVTVNIRIGFYDFGNLAIASADTNFTYQGEGSFGIVTSALTADASSEADLEKLTFLQPAPDFDRVVNQTLENPNGAGSLIPYVDNDTGAGGFNDSVFATSANLKALGLIDPTTAEDGFIYINSAVPGWDLDRSDGIIGKDFIGTVSHEIGHILGFKSGIDQIDLGTTADGPFGEDFWIPSIMDLFRFADDFGLGIPDISIDPGVEYFPLLGGGQAEFCNGTSIDCQASHWADGMGLGLMDPISTSNQINNISAIDTEMLDVIGWDLRGDDSDPPVQVPEPGTLALFGIGLLGMGLARRRKQV